MLVSIIIPVYNVAPYIEGCLKSVMRQTVAGPMECLLVDDCGSDESISIAERMIAEYEDRSISKFFIMTTTGVSRPREIQAWRRR